MASETTHSTNDTNNRLVKCMLYHCVLYIYVIILLGAFILADFKVDYFLFFSRIWRLIPITSNYWISSMHWVLDYIISFIHTFFLFLHQVVIEPICAANSMPGTEDIKVKKKWLVIEVARLVHRQLSFRVLIHVRGKPKLKTLSLS